MLSLLARDRRDHRQAGVRHLPPGQRQPAVRLRRDLDARGLEVVTLNGFPYRSFHAPVVKYAVYQPDWLSRERLDYTVNLARVLAGLLPPDATVTSGSVVFDGTDLTRLTQLAQHDDLPAAARWRATVNAAEAGGGYLEVSWRKDGAA